MGCKWVNPTLPCLSLITRLDSCWRLSVLDCCSVLPCVWEYSRPWPCTVKKNQHCSSPHLSLQPCLNIGPTTLLRPEAELSADIAPTADYWGWLVDTGPLLQCCFTDSSCLCLIVLPTAHSCVSSHELLWWIGQAYGIHNNILIEDIFICTGSVSSWSLQEKAWYRSPNTEDETGVEDYTQPP